MSNWSVLVHHDAARHYRPNPIRGACDARRETTPMLPMHATPLNERLIQVLIDEHQAEIRRCFAPRRDRGPAFRVRWLQRLVILLRWAHEPSPCWGTGASVQEGA
jgi:hypothetical protein